MSVLQDEAVESSEPVSITVVRTVADEEGVEPTDLPPLHDAVETDALGALFDSAHHDSVNVEFTYCGYTISIDHESHVHVESI